MKKKVQGHSFYVPGLHWTEKPDALLGRRDGDFTDFVETFMFPRRADLSAIGLKILDEQFFFAANQARLTDLISGESNMTLIFLYRQNALERFVSRMIRRGKLDLDEAQMLPAAEFEAFEKDSIDRMTQIYKLFPAHRRIVLSYEALATRLELTIAFLFGALGAELAPVTIEESKSAPRDLSALLENYAELSSLQLPIFNHDTDDNPAAMLEALDGAADSDRLTRAYELGRQFQN